MELTLHQRLLEAREGRQAAIDRLHAAGGTLVAAATNVPGADKRLPGLDLLFQDAGAAVVAALGATPLERGEDALGPWACFRTEVGAEAAKRAAIRVENDLPGGRLLDLDVYDPTGRQVDRASLGLPPRGCLVCDRPAVECIRLGRHPGGDVVAAATRLARRSLVGEGGPGRLAACLVSGARDELELTPKPGLVDHTDNGSHPDLSFEAMSRSIDLLPVYFGELLDAAEPLDLAAAVAAGERAERRMVAAVGSNTHKGYIFLAGLVLLAARRGAGLDALPTEVSSLARQVFDRRPPIRAGGGSPSHGERLRAAHGVGGILREALDGLPAVFDHGLPVLLRVRARPDPAGVANGPRATRHLVMAVLMQAVEDTTSVHRCGPEGLLRIKVDGLRLRQMIEDGDEYLPWLTSLNDEYRRLGLTMGGVADCMALCFALDEWQSRA